MAIENYTQLAAAVSSWLNRADLATRVPDFITMAQAEINRRLRHWRMVERTSIPFTTRYTPIPDDWLQGISLELETTYNRHMRNVSYETLMLERSANDTGGIPQLYAVKGSDFDVWPTPGDAFDVEVTYYASMPVPDPTNWLLTLYPDVYLYGSLKQSAPYLKADNRLPMWTNEFDRIMAQLNLESTRATVAGNTPIARGRAYG